MKKRSKANAASYGKHFSPSMEDSPHPFPPDFVQKPPSDITDTCSDVTPQERRIAMSSTKMNSAPRKEGIRWPMIAALHNAIPDHLCTLFSSLLLRGIHPNPWKTAKCILITKPGQKDTNAAKSYRLVSHLSYVGKTLEKVVARRLNMIGAQLGPFGENHMRLRPHRSPEDALLRILTPAPEWLTKPKNINGHPPPSHNTGQRHRWSLQHSSTRKTNRTPHPPRILPVCCVMDQGLLHQPLPQLPLRRPRRRPPAFQLRTPQRIPPLTNPLRAILQPNYTKRPMRNEAQLDIHRRRRYAIRHSNHGRSGRRTPETPELPTRQSNLPRPELLHQQIGNHPLGPHDLKQPQPK